MNNLGLKTPLIKRHRRRQVSATQKKMEIEKNWGDK